MRLFELLSLSLSAAVCSALDNGLAITPPLGFRTWNQFGLNVNTTMMEQTFRAMVDRSRTVDGRGPREGSRMT